jgi:DNA-binding CsgD family transcriptional regulator
MLHRLHLLLLCLLTSWKLVAAQSVTPSLVLEQVGVLPAAPYSWDRIRTNSSLAYSQVDSLRPAQARQFWLQLTVRNRSHYTEATRLTVLPNLDNTLYYFDEDKGAWRTQRAGVTVATDSQRTKGRLPLLLPGRATTTCYVLVRLGERASLPSAIRLHVSLEPAAVVHEADAFFQLAWAVSLAVVTLLLVTNVLAYSRRPDRITLYYVCTQVGALLYITAFRGYFKALCPSPIFSELVRASGLSYAYTLNNVAMHLSVVLMLVGFVQVTCAYLPTRARLPRLDAALRYGLRGYCVFAVVVGLVNLCGFYLNQYTLLYDNLLVLGLVGLLLATSVAAYRQRLPLASPFLLANILPLLSIVGVAAYHIVIGFDNNGNLLLPDLAIVAHALGFSAALNLRLQAVQHTLLTTEREAAALALDIERQELRHREIVLKNSHIQTALLAMQHRQQARDEHAQQLSADHERQQAANHALRTQLEANQRELASTTLYVEQKNALLAELKQQIQELRPQVLGRAAELASVQSLLQSSLHLDEDWGRFKLHFEQVHPRFFEDLQTRYPALTRHEQRLHCYFHIQLSTKEIAALLNIDPASVRRAKTRLFKKIATADQAAGRPAAPLPPE